MERSSPLPVALTAALLFALGAADARSQELAVIVHPGNPLASLSSADLREILLMERQHWSGGARIYVLLPPAGTPQKGVLLRRVLRMKDLDLRRHYLAKLYAGEISSFPHIAPSAEAAKRFVARAENALAFVEAAALDGTVKALAIDGRRPGEAQYPLAPGR